MYALHQIVLLKNSQKLPKRSDFFHGDLSYWKIWHLIWEKMIAERIKELSQLFLDYVSACQRSSKLNLFICFIFLLLVTLNDPFMVAHITPDEDMEFLTFLHLRPQQRMLFRECLWICLREFEFSRTIWITDDENGIPFSSSRELWEKCC